MKQIEDNALQKVKLIFSFMLNKHLNLILKTMRKKLGGMNLLQNEKVKLLLKINY